MAHCNLQGAGDSVFLQGQICVKITFISKYFAAEMFWAMYHTHLVQKLKMMNKQKTLTTPLQTHKSQSPFSCKTATKIKIIVIPFFSNDLAL